MRNSEVVVNPVKVEWVVQIPSMSVRDAFLEPKVAGVSCGTALCARLQPKLSFLRPRRARCFFWR